MATKQGGSEHLFVRHVLIVLGLAAVFFLISVVAGWFGFTGVASGARTIAKVLFFIFIVIFIIVLVFGVMLGQLVF